MSVDNPKWQKVNISPDGQPPHFIDVRAVSPQISAKMPETSRTFFQVGPIGMIIHDIKKVLHPDETIPY